MGEVDPPATSIVPLPEEIEAAKQFSGQWVYRIAGGFPEAAAVPPEAIVGAWKVDNDGVIRSSFLPNPKYDSKRYPGK